MGVKVLKGGIIVSMIMLCWGAVVLAANESKNQEVQLEVIDSNKGSYLIVRQPDGNKKIYKIAEVN
jgi:uncharacterized protein YccT (UPF0319 family)